MANSEIIRLTTEVELEALHTETLINTTSKVTKVSDQSVTRGLIRGNVRTAKKALKDIALAISHLFVDSAFGTALDEVADDHGVAPRFAAAQSSTFVRLVADAGTIYQQGINTVSDNKGNVFDLESDVTIGVKGYEYIKVRSQQSGASSNADPYTIINCAPEPAGHVGVINEYAATGGRDVEDDKVFKKRIKEGPDILARGTLDYLGQAFIKVNPNVLRVIYEGVNQQGKVVLAILTVNGIDLTNDELQAILEQAGHYLSLTELAPIGTTSYGVHLKNATYGFIDVDMRMELFVGASLDPVVKEIQQKYAKYVDFRFWNSSVDKVDWDTLLSIAKNTRSVKSVPDTHFTPGVDLSFPTNTFPRFRGFIVRDLAGTVLLNQSSTIDPVFYPSALVVNFQETVLN